jgi:hypothetical protein
MELKTIADIMGTTAPTTPNAVNNRAVSCFRTIRGIKERNPGVIPPVKNPRPAPVRDANERGATI